MGEHQHPGVHFVMVEEKRNILIGYILFLRGFYVCTEATRSLGIFSGFAAFFFMEKTLRVLGGGEEDGHSHSHSQSHTHEPPTAQASGASSSELSEGLRSRSKTETESENHSPPATISASGPSKLSAYLNLFGDFVHNM